MKSKAFKVIPHWNKSKQIVYIKEKKDSIFEVQKLDHTVICRLLAETYTKEIFNFIRLKVCKYVSNILYSKIYNNYINY